MTREEAIERVRQWSLPKETMEVLKVLAPELKESEDERIRKRIRLCLDECVHSDIIRDYERDECLAYLEKQKESPKSADFISSDCISDAKCENLHNEEGDFVFELRQIISSHRYSDIYGEYTNDEEGMASEILELCKCELEKQKEQKPVDDKAFEEWIDGWYNEHHRDGYITMDEREFKNFCRGIRNMYQQKPAEWGEEDKRALNNAIVALSMYANGEIPYLLPSQLLEDVERLKSLRPQPKNEWSEEDKKMLLSIIKAFRIGVLSTIGQEQWLKLLPERFNLQPSLEHLQKEKVYDIIAKLTNLSYSRLIPFNSEEYKKINEIISNVFDLLKYSVEKK